MRRDVRAPASAAAAQGDPARVRLAPSLHWRATTPRSQRMTDVVYIAVTTGLFALAWLYARACERL
jgi:hypothetical protein